MPFGARSIKPIQAIKLQSPPDTGRVSNPLDSLAVDPDTFVIEGIRFAKPISRHESIEGSAFRQPLIEGLGFSRTLHLIQGAGLPILPAWFVLELAPHGSNALKHFRPVFGPESHTNLPFTQILIIPPGQGTRQPGSGIRVVSCGQQQSQPFFDPGHCLLIVRKTCSVERPDLGSMLGVTIHEPPHAIRHNLANTAIVPVQFACVLQLFRMIVDSQQKPRELPVVPCHKPPQIPGEINVVIRHRQAEARPCEIGRKPAIIAPIVEQGIAGPGQGVATPPQLGHSAHHQLVPPVLQVGLK